MFFKRKQQMDVYEQEAAMSKCALIIPFASWTTFAFWFIKLLLWQEKAFADEFYYAIFNAKHIFEILKTAALLGDKKMCLIREWSSSVSTYDSQAYRTWFTGGNLLETENNFLQPISKEQKLSFPQPLIWPFWICVATTFADRKIWKFINFTTLYHFGLIPFDGLCCLTERKSTQNNTIFSWWQIDEKWSKEIKLN